AFSFFGNKVVSTGEGGMVVTNDGELARTMRVLKDQGMDPNLRYWHPVVGYNYRLTNVAAAIGLAQVEKSDCHLARRREIAGWYREQLEPIRGLLMQVEEEWARHVYQLFTISFDTRISISRDDMIAHLLTKGIEGRPVVYPLHMLPPYSEAAIRDEFPIAEAIALRGINLPTF